VLNVSSHHFAIALSSRIICSLLWYFCSGYPSNVASAVFDHKYDERRAFLSEQEHHQLHHLSKKSNRRLSLWLQGKVKTRCDDDQRERDESGEEKLISSIIIIMIPSSSLPKPLPTTGRHERRRREVIESRCSKAQKKTKTMPSSLITIEFKTMAFTGILIVYRPKMF
jgi:hypothetical protein